MKSIQEVACPYCHSEAKHFLTATDRNRRTTAMEFDYYSCDSCGLIFMHSPPADMSPFYTGGYGAIPSNVEELQKISALESYKIEPILRHKKSGRYLEIGPWYGGMSCGMKDAGFNVTVIEMDGDCVNFLRDKVGVDAIQSTDPALVMSKLQPGFDVIAAWHSMEHLPEPWRVLEEAAKLLAPGGILVLSMPNPESFEFSILKNRWMHLDAPRHIHLFSIKTLSRFCEKQGLQFVESTTADRFSEIQSKQTWMREARSWIPLPIVRGLLAESAGRLLNLFARPWQMREGRGSSYTVVFSRPE